jgi:hypothetical protein
MVSGPTPDTPVILFVQWPLRELLIAMGHGADVRKTGLYPAGRGEPKFSTVCSLDRRSDYSIWPHQSPSKIQIKVVPLAIVEDFCRSVLPGGNTEITRFKTSFTKNCGQDRAMYATKPMIVNVYVLDRITTIAQRIVPFFTFKDGVKVIQPGLDTTEVSPESDGKFLTLQSPVLEEFYESLQVRVVRLSLNRDTRRDNYTLFCPLTMDRCSDYPKRDN